jgi:hypothetical protein
MNCSTAKLLLHPIIVAVLALLTGCAGMVQVRVSDPVDLKPFGTTLRVGESTREDVLAAMGVPGGRGRAMLPIDKEPRTIWFYYYSVAAVSMADLKGKMDAVAVFVYFKGDRYDGSMYGSAFMK